MDAVRRGDVVLETEPTPQALEKLVNTLLRIYCSNSTEQLTALVTQPKPLILIRGLVESKSAELTSVLQRQGVFLRFAPTEPEADTAKSGTGPAHSRAFHLPSTTIKPPNRPSLSRTSFSSRVSAESNPGRTIAGFWRRLAAFLIDLTVLSAIGFFLGLVFSEPFIRMGSLGRLIGFAIALPYFGVLNSAVFGGQTIGKRLLDIKVVGRNGGLISLPRSTARASVLILPYFLNGLYFPFIPLPNTLNLVISWLLMLIVFGMGLSIVYLFLFNRRTRQSLHDVLLKTFVILEKAEDVAPRREIWPVHYAVTACILVASVTLPYFLSGNVKLDPGMTVLYKNLQQTGKYTFVEITDMKHKMGSVHSTSIDVKVWMKEKPETFRSAAENIAAKVFSLFPEVEARDYLAVSISRGFDIGIWSVSRTESFNLTPERWRKQLGDRVPSIISL